jgi:DNA-directed RNA polymerase specialized sigma24 family protein|tara:strand:- start:3997 stop:4299 length:303 start_codon:yes stop_codon:yes gene_type:complete
MDQGYNEEAAEQAEKAIKNLNVWKNCVEYLYERDNYDKDELKFAVATEKGWLQLTDLQKDIMFFHVIQGFSFTLIADIKGISPQAANQAFHRACKHFQTI